MTKIKKNMKVPWTSHDRAEWIGFGLGAIRHCMSVLVPFALEIWLMHLHTKKLYSGKIWLSYVLGLWWSRLWGRNVATILVSFNYIEGVCPMWGWSLRYLRMCDFDKGNFVVYWKSASFYTQFCVNRRIYGRFVCWNLDVCQFVCPFAGWLFWCEVGVTVNKDGTQSVKGGFPLKMLTLLSGRNTMLLLNAARMQLLMVMI